MSEGLTVWLWKRNSRCTMCKYSYLDSRRATLFLPRIKSLAVVDDFINPIDKIGHPWIYTKLALASAAFTKACHTKNGPVPIHFTKKRTSRVTCTTVDTPLFVTSTKHVLCDIVVFVCTQTFRFWHNRNLTRVNFKYYVKEYRIIAKFAHDQVCIVASVLRKSETM